MKTYKINKIILEGSITLEIKFKELAIACKQPNTQVLDVDVAIKKYLRQKGIKVIDTDLGIIAEGTSEIQQYKNRKR